MGRGIGGIGILRGGRSDGSEGCALDGGKGWVGTVQRGTADEKEEGNDSGEGAWCKPLGGI